MSEENKNQTALTKQSSNGLMRVENVIGITQKILNEISTKGFQFNYKTVEINGITYLAENLRETHFRNGDPITEVRSAEHWQYCTENKIPAFCYYDNDLKKDKTFGKLYNYYCLLDIRGLLPNDWRIIDKLPSKDSNLYQPELMSSMYWPSISEKISNQILDIKKFNTMKFNAIPSGMCNPVGDFSGFGTEFDVWKRPESGLADTSSYRRYKDDLGYYETIRLGIYLSMGKAELSNGIELGSGLAIRCIKTK